MSQARIHDQGYRRYEGERLGVSSAMTGLIVHATQRVLGIRRPFRSKLMPSVVLLVSFAPAVAFVGMAAFLNQIDGEDIAAEILPEYYEYYGTISLAVVLFASFVAPEVLCTDRNSGMLSLYLASPLTRDTYLAAKAAAVVSILLLVTMGPQLLLLIAYTLEGQGPGGVFDFLELLGRIVAGGIAAALLPAALSLAVSSLTPKRAFASAGIFVSLLGSLFVAAVLTEPEALDLDPRFALVDLLNLPFELAMRILEGRSIEGPMSRLSDGWLLVGNVFWVAVFAFVARTMYQRVAVDR